MRNLNYAWISQPIPSTGFNLPMRNLNIKLTKDVEDTEESFNLPMRNLNVEKPPCKTNDVFSFNLPMRNLNIR